MIRNSTLGVLVLPVLVFCQDAALAAIQDVREIGAGIEYRVDDTRVKVTFVTDWIVHVTATPNRDWSAATSLMRTAVAERPWKTTSSDKGGARLLRSKKVTVVVNRTTGAIAFRDA